LNHSSALVLFDIDGTLIRRAGPHHREALVDAIRRTAHVETTTDGVPVAGMLDRDILTTMMLRAGVSRAEIRRLLPDVMARAQSIYVRRVPDISRKVCPGVRNLLRRLIQHDAVIGLVTGNLSRIGWCKMVRAGLRPYFRFGAFAEMAHDRAGLVRIAIRRARQERWIATGSNISLIGDHPNDVLAAQANGIRAVAVGTGIVPLDELRGYSPHVLIPDLRCLKLDELL
jgi:phosphoglycolate phosphatase